MSRKPQQQAPREIETGLEEYETGLEEKSLRERVISCTVELYQETHAPSDYRDEFWGDPRANLREACRDLVRFSRRYGR
jgi:hypothetical protein